MKPIKSQLPFLYPENAPVPSNLVDAAMLPVADSLADAWGRYDLEFDELCRIVELTDEIDRRATEAAARKHLLANRLRIVKKTRPQRLDDPETGEFVANIEIDVFCVVGNDALWTWQELQTQTTGKSNQQKSNTAKGKVGRKSNDEQALKISREYISGLEKGEWKGQADYLRTKHRKYYDENPGSARSWLSQLLKRVRDKLKELPND